MRNMSEITSPLPPGIRFRPTDEEILEEYLGPKLLGQPDGHHSNLLREIEVLKFEPSELPSVFSHIFNGKELFFFCPVTRKYSNSKRSARTTKGGYWRHTGNAHAIVRKDTGLQIGFKNRLVFYEGSNRQSKITDWVMHEYHLNPKWLGNDHDENEMLPYVACRIKKKMVKKPMVGHHSPTPFNQEGEHSSDNPRNHAADNHDSAEVPPEMPVHLPLQRVDGTFSTHNTTPAYQSQAAADQGSSSLLDFPDDTNGFGHNLEDILGPIRSPLSDFGFCYTCSMNLSSRRCIHD